MEFLLGLVIGAIVALSVTAIVVRRRLRRLQHAEDRARRQERLAELGSMTGGLAHEIKNPLSTIQLNVQLALEEIDFAALPLAAREQLSRKVASVGREAARLQHILEDFLKFAGRIHLAPTATNLASTLGDLAEFFRPQTERSGVVLRVATPATAVEAIVDEQLLKQALLNLMINAHHALSAMPTGSNRELLLVLDAPTSTDVAVLHVVDTGPGIAPERCAEIFRPYVSSRTGGGSGLGLAVTRRIVEEHGGSIDLRSELGKGSDFCIRLPKSGPPATRALSAEDNARRGLLDTLLRRAEPTAAPSR
ncbi:MAG: two-component sensor histidine kinase [Phycisphaerales bacterium]|nr:two-component sensor histidine kinase [Phycisphaerales bacterium]